MRLCNPVSRVRRFSIRCLIGGILVRKVLVFVKFLSAILGPEMGASILWTPGKMRSFCRKKPMSIKFLVRGGSADFIFKYARIFLNWGVRAKGVVGRDAIVHRRRRNSSQKATQ